MSCLQLISVLHCNYTMITNKTLFFASKVDIPLMFEKSENIFIKFHCNSTVTFKCDLTCPEFESVFPVWILSAQMGLILWKDMMKLQSTPQDRVFSKSPAIDTLTFFFTGRKLILLSQANTLSIRHDICFLQGMKKNKRNGMKCWRLLWCSSLELPLVATLKRWDGSFLTSERACSGKLTLFYEDKVTFE